MERSDIPFGAHFSPNQIDLLRLLHLCKKYEGNREAQEAAIQKNFFRSKGGNAYNQAKLANNAALEMIAHQ